MLALWRADDGEKGALKTKQAGQDERGRGKRLLKLSPQSPIPLMLIVSSHDDIEYYTMSTYGNSASRGRRKARKRTRANPWRRPQA